MEAPLSEPHVVLDLLYRRWGDGTTREINRYGRAGDSLLEIGHHHDFSESTYYLFSVELDVVLSLFDRRLVAGKPQWGWTNNQVLSLTDAGLGVLQARRDELGIGWDFDSFDWFMDWYRFRRRDAFRVAKSAP